MTALFRQEVLQHRRDTWLGDIVLVRPASFAVWTVAIVSVLLVTLAYVVWGEYTKKARASGYVVPEDGLIKLYSQQSGTIVSLLVREGQVVAKGQLLAVVSNERTGEKGDTQAQIAQQLALKAASLDLQKRDTHALYDHQRESAALRLGQIRAQESELADAIAAQRQRLAIAREAFDKNFRLFQDNFVSELALQEKKGELLDQESRLHDLERTRLALERDAVAAETELRTLPLKENNDVHDLGRQLAQIASDSLENEVKRQTYVLAPESGTVTAVQIDSGKSVGTQDTLMSLIPTGTRLLADLYVPSKSVGFVRVGSHARLQYQPFPYQKFGSHDATVIRVSRTAVPAQELPFPAPAGDIYYIVTVRPEHEYVTAYGKQEPLQSGMQVDADIWLDTRRLFEWILEPLYSVSGRL